MRVKSSGLTIVELLLALGIASIIGVIVATVLGGTAKVQSNSFSRTQIDLIRRDIIRLISNPTKWQLSVNGTLNSSALRCIRESTPCTTSGAINGTALGNVPFALYREDGSILVNGAAAASGFTTQGAPCQTFSASSGNDACPYRYDLTWSAICQVGACTNPLIKVLANFSYKPQSADAVPMNPAAMNVIIYIGAGAAGPTSTAPVCTGITHTPNAKTFSVNWTAGSGIGLCKLQYQRRNGAWADITTPASVDCDADGSSVGVVTLPGDDWLGGGWSSAAAVRLVRSSDNSVMCALGGLSCSVRSGSLAATPLLDEDCNNHWDNFMAGPSHLHQCYEDIPDLTQGASYTCAPTMECDGQTTAIGEAMFWASPLAAQVLSFCDSTCTCGGGATAYRVGNWGRPASGTVPFLNSLGPSGKVSPVSGFSPSMVPPTFDATSTACVSIGGTSLRMSAPVTAWQEGWCYYSWFGPGVSRYY